MILACLVLALAVTLALGVVQVQVQVRLYEFQLQNESDSLLDDMHLKQTRYVHSHWYSPAWTGDEYLQPVVSGRLEWWNGTVCGRGRWRW